MTSKKSKYERIICDSIPYFTDASGALYIWENNGGILSNLFQIGHLSECGEHAIINQTKEVQSGLEEKLHQWRETQRPRPREDIRRADGVATINPGAATTVEGGETKEETAKKPRVRAKRTTTVRKPRGKAAIAAAAAEATAAAAATEESA